MSLMLLQLNTIVSSNSPKEPKQKIKRTVSDHTEKEIRKTAELLVKVEKVIATQQGLTTREVSSLVPGVTSNWLRNHKHKLKKFGIYWEQQTNTTGRYLKFYKRVDNE